MAKVGRPTSYRPEYCDAVIGSHRARTCNFVDRDDLDAAEALRRLEGRRPAGFDSEREYREWFIHEALPDLIPHLCYGAKLSRVEKEQAVIFMGPRIDLVATAENGLVVGFELKATNKKNPQTAGYSLMGGVGQALFYQDVLTERHGRFVPVYLVADFVNERVASLIMRHGFLIGLIEANRDHILCMGRGDDVAAN